MQFLLVIFFICKIKLFKKFIFDFCGHHQQLLALRGTCNYIMEVDMASVSIREQIPNKANGISNITSKRLRHDDSIPLLNVDLSRLNYDPSYVCKITN
uniref:Uncharacterized protein n=1 Tax=Glossina morsitans morsitans TaxID=37546 RepID=A0A1B0F9V2_GLOMM